MIKILNKTDKPEFNSNESLEKHKYSVTYKFVDFDASPETMQFKTWKKTASFLKCLLDDGYEILAVNG